MSELDVLLRESLGRLAEPGDPTGVAEAIRARVEAAGSSGDGSPGDGGSGAGGGGGSGGTFWSGPGFLGILIGLSVAGGAALGASGAVGRPDAPPNPPTGPAAGIVQGQVWALGCPGGSPVEALPPGTRVLAMERSTDGGFVSVRNPYELGQTVWLPTSVLIPDVGEGKYSDLPPGGCAQASPIPSPSPSPSPVASPSPSPQPVPEPPPAPAPTKKPVPPPAPTTPPPAPTTPPPAPTTPPPAPDTQAPTISVGQFSPSEVTGDNSGCGGAHTTDIIVTATDNVGVAGVSASDNHANVSVTQIAHSGNTWTFRFSATSQPSMGSNVSVTGSFTATDSAGNSSGASSAFNFNYCLF